MQGAGVCRGQGFAGDRSLKGTGVCRGSQETGVHRKQKFAGNRDLQGQGFTGWLQAPTEPGPRAVRLALASRVLALSASSLTVPGFLGGHRAVITTNAACCVVGTWHRADHTGLPQELWSWLGAACPALSCLHQVPLKTECILQPKLHSRLSPSKNETNTHGLQFELQLN